jgi:hypothetical protein
LILKRLGSSVRQQPKQTLKPFPYSICLFILALSVCCAGWVIRALFRRNLGTAWLIPSLLGISFGIFLGIKFSAITYDYEPGWRVVGFPMVAAALKYKTQLKEWWDYIDWPPPVVIAANFIFWTVIPFLILFPLAWLYISCFRLKSKCMQGARQTAS